MGWYHSHPSYGCWLSGIDVATSHRHQMVNDPFLAIVVDPIKSINFRIFSLIQKNLILEHSESIQLKIMNSKLEKNRMFPEERQLILGIIAISIMKFQSS